ncbi:TRAM domain-containing protein [Fodinicola feengrottensis]|uniref:TRAM domain-containing protein n=1 Tax=Fodinicola feengrottensis TaxID=435914 RepID=UPI0024417367|nr:TRAM domain-containing protein [Fodinicola feengrottensis]
MELDVGPIAHGGHCVARHDGRVIFVRHSLPGERVRARITSDNGKAFALAEAVEILTPSPDRVRPPCRVLRRRRLRRLRLAACRAGRGPAWQSDRRTRTAASTWRSFDRAAGQTRPDRGRVGRGTARWAAGLADPDALRRRR